MTTPVQISPKQHARTLQRLQKFRRWLKDCGDLWKQITSATCDVEGRWINLATTILSEFPARKRRIVRPMSDSPHAAFWSLVITPQSSLWNSPIH